MVVTLLVLVACGDDGSPSGTDAGARTDSGGASGTDAGTTRTDAGRLPDAAAVPDTGPRRDAGADRMCPPAMDTRCGDSCTGSETMCLCNCGGGGFDFTACDCLGGSWTCPEC